MPLVHVIFLDKESQLFKHSCAAYTEHNFLFEPVVVITSVETMGNAPVLRRIFSKVRIEEDNGNFPACSTFNYICPCPYDNLSPLNMDHYLFCERIHKLLWIELIGNFSLPAVYIELLPEISFFCQ